MTAIIAILNKSAVAIAADSAVTVGTGRASKVYNHANKIFSLASGNKVAVLIYNSAEFLGVPWETVIKEYRGSSKNVLPTTADYGTDFISFLKAFKTRYKLDNEDETLSVIINKALNTVESPLQEAIKESFPSAKDWNKLALEERTSFLKSTIEQILLSTIEIAKEKPVLNTHKSDSNRSLERKFAKVIRDISNDFLGLYELNDNKVLLRLIGQLVVLSIKKEILLEPYTGLVLVGFGSEEIYPSLISYNVGGVINKKIRYHQHGSTQVTQNRDAVITPFAQTDIMSTFVEGIDPFVRDSVPALLESALNEFRKYILSSVDFSTAKEKALKLLLERSIPKVVHTFVQRLGNLRAESHIDPMLATIGTLSKEDLTELAESLINLTYLKRRATFNEESVGGPVDVAVITKGDGFIWIKRKHYFRPELNLEYIARTNSLNKL